MFSHSHRSRTQIVVIAVVQTLAGVALIGLPAKVDASDEKSSNSEFQKLLAAGTIKQMFTADGKAGDSAQVQTTTAGDVQEQTKYVNYVLDSGYVRYSFSGATTFQSPNQATVDWEDGCAYDPAVKLYVKAMGINGSAKAEVTIAYQIQEMAYLKLQKQEFEARSKRGH